MSKPRPDGNVKASIAKWEAVAAKNVPPAPTPSSRRKSGSGSGTGGGGARTNKKKSVAPVFLTGGRQPRTALPRTPKPRSLLPKAPPRPSDARLDSVTTSTLSSSSIPPPIPTPITTPSTPKSQYLSTGLKVRADVLQVFDAAGMLQEVEEEKVGSSPSPSSPSSPSPPVLYNGKQLVLRQGPRLSHFPLTAALFTEAAVGIELVKSLGPFVQTFPAEVSIDHPLDLPLAGALEGSGHHILTFHAGSAALSSSTHQIERCLGNRTYYLHLDPTGPVTPTLTTDLHYENVPLAFRPALAQAGVMNNMPRVHLFSGSSPPDLVSAFKAHVAAWNPKEKEMENSTYRGASDATNLVSKPRCDLPSSVVDQLAAWVKTSSTVAIIRGSMDTVANLMAPGAVPFALPAGAMYCVPDKRYLTCGSFRKSKIFDMLNQWLNSHKVLPHKVPPFGNWPSNNVLPTIPSTHPRALVVLHCTYPRDVIDSEYRYLQDWVKIVVVAPKQSDIDQAVSVGNLCGSKLIATPPEPPLPPVSSLSPKALELATYFHVQRTAYLSWPWMLMLLEDKGWSVDELHSAMLELEPFFTYPASNGRAPLISSELAIPSSIQEGPLAHLAQWSFRVNSAERCWLLANSDYCAYYAMKSGNHVLFAKILEAEDEKSHAKWAELSRAWLACDAARLGDEKSVLIALGIGKEVTYSGVKKPVNEPKSNIHNFRFANVSIYGWALTGGHFELLETLRVLFPENSMNGINHHNQFLVNDCMRIMQFLDTSLPEETQLKIYKLLFKADTGRYTVPQYFFSNGLRWIKSNELVKQVCLSEEMGDISSQPHSRMVQLDTGLRTAIATKNLELLKWLLEWADPLLEDTFFLENDCSLPSVLACTPNQPEFWDVVMSHRRWKDALAKPDNLASLNGRSSFSQLVANAAMAGFIDVLKMIVDKVFDGVLDPERDWTSTLLENAIRVGHIDAVRWVVEEVVAKENRGAALNIVAYKAATFMKLDPYLWALSFTGPDAVDVDAHVDTGARPRVLDAALGSGNRSFTDPLLGRSVALLEESKSSSKLLVASIVRNSHSVVDWLLEKVPGTKENVDKASADHQGRTPLNMACCVGDLSIVELLVGKGGTKAGAVVDVNGWGPLRNVLKSHGYEKSGVAVWLLRNKVCTFDSYTDPQWANDGETQDSITRLLFDAVDYGQKEVLELVLADKSVDPEPMRMYDDHTILTYAIECCDEDTARVIIKACPSLVSVQGNMGTTPLSMAVAMEEEGLVRFLLEEAGAGPTVHVADNSGTTVLQEAAQTSESIMSVLLEYAPKEQLLQAGPDGITPLCLACRSGFTMSVQLLVDAGASLTKPVADGRTPVFFPLEYGRGTFLKWLVDEFQGGHPELLTTKATDRDGTNLLHLMAKRGGSGILEWALDKHKMDENSIDKSTGGNLLHTASLWGTLDNITYLVKRRPDWLETKTRAGWTPLAVATTRHYAPAVAELIKAGASPWAVDYEGNNVLALACATGSSAAIREVLQATKDEPDRLWRSENVWGQSPFWMACGGGDFDLIETCWSESHRSAIDPNKPDCYGVTPLMKAVKTNNSHVVQQLLTVVGVDDSLETPDHLGQTPVLVASLNQDRHVLNQLNTALKRVAADRAAATGEGDDVEADDSDEEYMEDFALGDGMTVADVLATLVEPDTPEPAPVVEEDPVPQNDPEWEDPNLFFDLFG